MTAGLWRRSTCRVPTLIVVAFACLAWLFVTQTVADADLWGHLRFGLDLLQTHHFPHQDTYSFTADRIWINHEWLAELAMAAAYHVSGSLGLNLLKMLAIALIALIAVSAARSERAPFIPVAILVLLVVLATYTRTQVIRPQLFSVVLFCFVLYSMHAADQNRDRALLAVPLYFGVWVNVHGGWIVGFACFSVWSLAGACSAAERRRLLAAVWLATAIATLLNPYGTGLWRFLFETVRPTRPDITDWKPFAQLPAGIIALDLLLPVIAVCATVFGRRKVRWQYIAILVMLACGTWRIGRVDAFLEAAVGILQARQIVGWFHDIGGRLRAAIWRVQVPLGGALASAATTATFVVGLLQLQTISIEGAWLPDRAAVEFVGQACTGQNLLTWFDWGEYAIWHLSSTGIRVSMDGRRETVYSESVLAAHAAFYRNDSTAADYPDRIAATCAWLPARFGAVTALQARGWTVVARTDTSAVLRRATDGPSVQSIPAGSGPRRFPGP